MQSIQYVHTKKRNRKYLLYLLYFRITLTISVVVIQLVLSAPGIVVHTTDVICGEGAGPAVVAPVALVSNLEAVRALEGHVAPVGRTGLAVNAGVPGVYTRGSEERRVG